MKNIIKINILVFVTAIIFSCQKDISIPPLPYENRISIQSLIEPDSTPRVSVQYTVPFFDKKIYNADLVIRNAIVKIIGNGTVDLLHLDSSYDQVNCDYIFWFQGNVPIANNKEYNLSVEYNNEILTASATTNLLPVTFDSVGYTKTFTDLYGVHEGVIAYFKDVSAQTNFYRYEMIRPVDSSLKHASVGLSTACLGSDTISVLEYGRSVYNDINLDGQQLKLVIEPAYTHREGIETKVRIATIDKNAYNFLDQLDKQKLGVYNPFVEPVFLVDGQFGNKAIGFFGSMKRSESIDFTFPE